MKNIHEDDQIYLLYPLLCFMSYLLAWFDVEMTFVLMCNIPVCDVINYMSIIPFSLWIILRGREE